MIQRGIHGTLAFLGVWELQRSPLRTLDSIELLQDSIDFLNDSMDFLEDSIVLLKDSTDVLKGKTQKQTQKQKN